jgi:hypothetical protein
MNSAKLAASWREDLRAVKCTSIGRKARSPFLRISSTIRKASSEEIASTIAQG